MHVHVLSGVLVASLVANCNKQLERLEICRSNIPFRNNFILMYYIIINYLYATDVIMIQILQRNVLFW